MIRALLHRPIACIFLAVALTLLGAVAWRLLPVAPLPQVDFPTIEVRAELPGASPESMASTVAAPLERALGSIAGVSAMSSSSNQGATRVQLQFELDRDVNEAARDVQAALNAARAELPAGMPGNPSYRKVNPSQAPIMALALSSPTRPAGQLYDLGSTVLAQKLSQISGVGEVTMGGSSLPAVRVQVNPNALAHYGVALDEVRQAIADAAPMGPQGQLDSAGQRWEVGTPEQPRSAREYDSLIVRHRDGAVIRLSQVAKVSDSVENRYSSGFHNRNPAVVLTISRQPGSNIIETIRAINQALPGLRALMPADVDLTVALDRSPGIDATLREAHITLGLATALVILVVWAFLGNGRAAAIPSVAIPVCLIATFAVMYLWGFSLNNLSLMALIVAAGLVVDDAIVVLENISRHLERGLSPRAAALRGVREVGFTLVAMTVALSVVFVSILFMGGLVERLFREFSITLVAATVISLVVSVAIIPSLCARWLKPAAPPDPAARPSRLRAAHVRIHDWYGRSLSRVLGHARLTLLLLAGVVGLNVYLYVQAPKGFLPVQDTGQLVGFVRGDDGFSFQVMQPKIDVYRQLVLKHPAVQDVIGYNGGSLGISNSLFLIRLKPASERKESSTEVINWLRSNAPPVPGGMFFLNVDQDLRMPGGFGNSGDHELAIMASDVPALRQWSRRISRAMQEIPELRDVDAEGDGATQQVVIDIDRSAAQRLGVDMGTISSVLSNSFSQRQVATLYDAMNQYRVVLELDPRYTEDAEVLEQVQVVAEDGRRVPLTAFATYEYGLVNDRVYHDGLFAAVGVGFSLAEGVSLEQGLAAIDAAMARLMVPSYIQTRLGGDARNFQQSLQDQPWLILAVLVAIYLVLGVLYESPLHPLTILSTLPSAGVGALLALRLAGLEFTLIALLGLFLLVGIVMKNAILMIDFALGLERREGLTPEQAIHRAAMLRLRPIMMTNLAGLLGALPLVLGMGEGSELRRPLGIAIVGGLMISQFLTLYTTPIVYLALERLRLKRRAAALG
ncbi:acriflavine resistance protein B [Achromobacter denitrificans]|uniref:efflux RND transporter permease subunit n=2 Tax=Achromobacter denitrificans TaxID=32002 RepID=UPI00078955E1|nr:efflux RND transporter permease subunit [Achromobacter denitrificans]MDX3879287.1 efflux RND transporter permease subunit [Achromobacter sp.]MBV2162412.1 efflux RND transporter permease subunit [Achromobacter denitrificans]OLU06445.1 acriflavine resistance protein B [Achromobacter denitrificans]QCS66202.1 acriflavine resistance protein B [Achromobacter denitrificans]QKH40971.1 efflux RND transporter permease subunit [Achromobacter denitrificans]